MKSKQLGLAGALLISTLSSSAWAIFGATDVFDDEISQVLPTVARQVYRVSFEFGTSAPTGPQDFSVMLGRPLFFPKQTWARPL
jgi:hypothetical protein